MGSIYICTSFKSAGIMECIPGKSRSTSALLPLPLPPPTQDDPSSFRFTFCKWATVIDCPVSGRQIRELYNKSNKATLSPFGCERREAFRRSWIISRCSRAFAARIAPRIRTRSAFDHFYKSFRIVSVSLVEKYSVFYLTPPLPSTRRSTILSSPGNGVQFAHSVHRIVIIEITINGGDALFRR